jgi:broad specificity phosphatase PhoE
MSVRVPRIVAVLSIVGLALSLLVPALALADPPKTVLYLVRHTDTQMKLNATTEAGKFSDECNEKRSCCTVILNPLGQERADALADWFVQQRLAATLTHLLGTNKPRTVQTLQGLADVTGLPIEQTPPETECAPGFLTTQGSKALVIAAIQALPLQSRAVIANHSDTMYEIVRVALGLDTSDPIDFPKQPGTTDRIDGFNNLWIVEVDGGGHGRLLEHVVLDLQAEGRIFGLGRARGVGDGEDIHDPSE